MDEIWKDIVGYEGLYQVSNKGRVKSLRYYGGNNEQIKSLGLRSDGYLNVSLSKNGKAISKSVHRLVAVAFIPNPENLEMVNHIDENKENNCVENLEWCTRSYNQIYSLKRHPERKKVFGDNLLDENGNNQSTYNKKGLPHKYKQRVIQKEKNGTYIKTFNNASEAGMILGFSSGDIISACIANSDEIRKRKRTSHGYIWEFEK